MKPRHLLTLLLCLAALAGGFLASACLAGQLYFLLNKTLPREFAIDTWYRYWQAHHAHPVQKTRLVIAAVVAPLLVFGLPLLAAIGQQGRERSLHGDARWANTGEIRKAGLL